MFNETRFADLLHKAIGERTTTQYADLTGVNRTYISKLLNKKLNSPPSPEIIKRLASMAFNEITYEEFMAAAGHITLINELGEKEIRGFIKEHGVDWLLEVARAEKGQTPPGPDMDAFEEALAQNKELLSFWQEFKQREDLQILFKQARQLKPDSVRKIVEVIKMIKDKDAKESK
ncbi:MAG: hypothetical protein ACYC2T_06120 [Bacillota bacterium]